MSISKEQLKKYRELAENTMMISALGEYTPSEFIELLDYIEELETQLTMLAPDKGQAAVNSSNSFGSAPCG